MDRLHGADGDADDSSASGVGPRETALLTQPDVTTGTPAYMAPEAALGDGPVDRRADLYALGCVGYWLLTGKLVFEADTPVKMMLRHIQAQPVPPSQVSELEIPAELDRVVLQCLAKDPADRYPDAMALSCALEAIPLRERWNTARAEAWWSVHSPAAAPMTELRPPTPNAMLHAQKGEVMGATPGVAGAAGTGGAAGAAAPGAAGAAPGAVEAAPRVQ